MIRTESHSIGFGIPGTNLGQKGLYEEKDETNEK
jgi:hypothetical protein